jgi:hypothetical protein
MNTTCEICKLEISKNAKIVQCQECVQQGLSSAPVHLECGKASGRVDSSKYYFCHTHYNPGDTSISDLLASLGSLSIGNRGQEPAIPSVCFACQQAYTPSDPETRCKGSGCRVHAHLRCLKLQASPPTYISESYCHICYDNLLEALRKDRLTVGSGKLSSTHVENKSSKAGNDAEAE